MSRRLCSGNRMVAEGALAAGCRFFAGYPITPASEIYEVMMRELPARGGLALSAPDNSVNCAGWERFPLVGAARSR